VAANPVEELKALSAVVDKRAADHEARVSAQEVDTPDAPEAAEPVGDTAPIVKVLGVDEAKAKMILECAQTFDWLKDMNPQELADHLSGNAGDMQMIMMEVARKQDAASDATIEGDVYGTGTTGTESI
jgi:hypothetical protein